MSDQLIISELRYDLERKERELKKYKDIIMEIQQLIDILAFRL